MSMGQDKQMQMVEGNVRNQFRLFAGQNVRNQNGYNASQNVGNQVVSNAVQNLAIQNVGNQNGFIVVPRIANQNVNQNRNGNVVAARADGNEAGIQLQAEEFDLMAAAGDLDEIEEVNANCILMENLQQASTSGTQTDKAHVYDSDGLVEHKALEFEIELFPRAIVSQDIMSIVQNPTVVDTIDLQTELERTKESSDLGDQKGISRILHVVLATHDPLSQILEDETWIRVSDSKVIPKVGESNALLKPVTSNVEQNDHYNRLILNVMPNKPVKASVRTKPITTSQPHVISQGNVNFNSNGFSSTGIERTAKTRRP
ncbi:hypothetical protein Tco_0277482 [Tanacetum coccineum]